MTQRIAVFLLNSMACHVDGQQKVLVGQLNAIEVILAQIQRKHHANVCDDVMEVGWSFLWNITGWLDCIYSHDSLWTGNGDQTDFLFREIKWLMKGMRIN